MKSNNGSFDALGTSGQAEQEIKRYLKIIQKRKWLIAGTFVGAFLVWMVYIILFQSHPKYTARALLTYQDPRSMSAVVEKNAGFSGHVSLITSNKLLGDIVEEYKFNVSVQEDDLRKNSLFEHLDVTRESIPGDYKIVISGNEYELFYSNKERGIRENRIATIRAGDTVSVNKMSFTLNTNYLESFKDKKKIEFRVNRVEDSIQFLRSIISFRTDRGGLITISGTFSSPWFAAAIVNSIAEKFVEITLNMKRYKTKEELRILENELALAKKEIEMANEEFKEFREKYPWVVLRPTTTTQIDLINDFEKKKGAIEAKINAFRELNEKLEGPEDIDKKIVDTGELLTYLDAEGITLIPAFKGQFNNLTNNRKTLLQNYAPTHPFVAENESEINKLISKIVNASKNQIVQLETQIEELQQNTNQERYKLRSLPAKEIELAELVRNRDIKTNIYNNIVARLNRAKIENEVEISDILIIDRAVPPPVVSPIADLIKKALMGLILAIGFGFGVAIVVEFFNKTVDNVNDLQNKLKLPVIGSIPYISSNDKDSDDLTIIKGKKDPRLITLDYSPTPESESYRDLRTKILYMNRNQNLSSFLVTSLKPGEGKSLTSSNIAVTLAQQKISTVLIDGDLRRGVLHNVFTNKKKPGLADFLISKATVDYNNFSKLIQTTFVPNLFLISSGTPVPNPSELMGSERMKSVMEVLNSRFGMVILDTPPFQASTDAVIISTLIDFVLLVVRSASTNVEQLEQKINEYPFLRGKIAGVILNMIKTDLKKSQYKYSYYQY